MWEDPNDSMLRECMYSVELMIKNSAGEYQTVFEVETREMQIKLTSLIPGHSYLVEISAVYLSHVRGHDHSYLVETSAVHLSHVRRHPSRIVQLSFKQGIIRIDCFHHPPLFCCLPFISLIGNNCLTSLTFLAKSLQKQKNQCAPTVHFALIV